MECVFKILASIPYQVASPRTANGNIKDSKKTTGSFPPTAKGRSACYKCMAKLNYTQSNLPHKTKSPRSPTPLYDLNIISSTAALTVPAASPPGTHRASSLTTPPPRWGTSRRASDYSRWVFIRALTVPAACSALGGTRRAGSWVFIRAGALAAEE